MMQSKTRHPLWMPLNDVREDSDRIRPGEEASSLSQTGCLPAGTPMRVRVRRTGTRDELISEQKGVGGGFWDSPLWAAGR